MYSINRCDNCERGRMLFRDKHWSNELKL